MVWRMESDIVCTYDGVLLSGHTELKKLKWK